MGSLVVLMTLMVARVCSRRLCWFLHRGVWLSTDPDNSPGPASKPWEPSSLFVYPGRLRACIQHRGTDSDTYERAARSCVRGSPGVLLSVVLSGMAESSSRGTVAPRTFKHVREPFRLLNGMLTLIKSRCSPLVRCQKVYLERKSSLAVQSL